MEPVKVMENNSKTKKVKDWHKLNYFVPIKEYTQSATAGDFLIRGTAINATVTRNNVKYTVEELSTSAPTLKDRPILKDHNNSVDSIVGRTTQNVYYNQTKQSVEFEGKIMDKNMQEMISDGRISSVSVGAMVQDLVAEEGNQENPPLVAKGITFVELSLVAVPADPNAGFEKAIAESWQIKNEDVQVQESLHNEVNGGNTMEDEINSKLAAKEKENLELAARLQEYENRELARLREEYKSIATSKHAKVSADVDKMTKEQLELVCNTLKTIETPKVEEKVEVKETKGKVVTPAVQESNGLSFELESSDFGFGSAMYAKNLGEKYQKFAWENNVKYPWEAQ